MGKDRGVPNRALRKARELRGWSQQHLANQLQGGASQALVSDWERGKQVPSPDYRRQLCVLFKMSAEELGFLSPQDPSMPDPRASQPSEERGAEQGVSKPEPLQSRQLYEVLNGTSEALGYPQEQMPLQEEAPPPPPVEQTLLQEGAPPARRRRFRVIWWVMCGLIIALLIFGIVSRTVFPPPRSGPEIVPVTNPQGVHDTNVEVYLTTVQSASYVIPGQPTSYSLGDLPTTSNAVRIDSKMPYHIIVGIHSLQQGRFGLIIEEVALLVKQLPPMPYPLNIWTTSPPPDYHGNPYLVMYRGQAAGSMLAAVYTPLPDAHVQLTPGEADELDIQVVSKTIADLQFQIQITYRVANESQLHTLGLPKVFEVVFSDRSNWHSYHLDGHLVPDTSTNKDSLGKHPAPVAKYIQATNAG